jgi:phosphoglycerate dehydrogenase-like enzyme
VDYGVGENMSKVRIVVLDDLHRAYGDRPALDRLRERAEVKVYTELAPSREALISRLAGAEVIVANRDRTRFDAELLNALPDLKLLVQSNHRSEHIDLAAATKMGVLVTVATGGSATAAMSELTIGLMIATLRRMTEQDRALRAGQWPYTIGVELDGLTLGIVGLGRLGTRVAAVARLFGMRVLATGITLTAERAQQAGAELRDLEALLAESDVVSIHLKFSESTHGFITERHLAIMKPTAILINTARGALVDEAGLVRALKEGWIAGAGLDVFEQEPLPPDHPLLDCENTVLTAHCGWPTEKRIDRFVTTVVENIEGYLNDGRPVHVFNPEARPDLGLSAYSRS